jgi:hypothetical protein
MPRPILIVHGLLPGDTNFNREKQKPVLSGVLRPAPLWDIDTEKVFQINILEDALGKFSDRPFKSSINVEIFLPVAPDRRLI